MTFNEFKTEITRTWPDKEFNFFEARAFIAVGDAFSVYYQESDYSIYAYAYDACETVGFGKTLNAAISDAVQALNERASILTDVSREIGS